MLQCAILFDECYQLVSFLLGAFLGDSHHQCVVGHLYATKDAVAGEMFQQAVEIALEIYTARWG